MTKRPSIPMYNVRSLKNVLTSPWLLSAILPWRRCIFLDCGGNDGCSARKFRETYDPLRAFEIFTFEPNPEYFSIYPVFASHTLIRAAVDVVDGSRQFYLDREDGDGSTLYASKLTQANGGVGSLDFEKPIEVPTIDLSAWMRAHTQPHDYIILKLDIEGSEYDVLERMIEDDTLRYIDQLYIEWHWFKVGIPEPRHCEVLEAITAAGIPITDWDAQDFRKKGPV